MKELSQVANVYRELAQLYIIKRNKPAYKSGNLYNRVGEYNTFDRMVTIKPSKSSKKSKIKVQSYNLSLSFAPPGAKYGKIVHDGLGLGRNSVPRPFAEEAANDKRLKKTINNALNGVIDDEILPQIRKQIDKAFIKFLSKK
jgi:hypothetical protein